MCEKALEGNVAIVTGGACGIGKRIALVLAEAGANIVICDINKEAIDTALEEVKKMGVEAEGWTADVTCSSSVDEMVSKTIERFKRIDILVNNAGITKDGLLIRMKEEDWDAVLAVNLKGTFNFTKAVSKVMMKQRYGRIVSIASIIGLIGNAGQANYAASKGGIISFTKSVAKELGPRNVTVNAIAPGFIQTAMTDKLPEQIKSKMKAQIPLGEFGTPEDVANAVLFLTGSSSRYITGQVITVDGGMVM